MEHLVLVEVFQLLLDLPPLHPQTEVVPQYLLVLVPMLPVVQGATLMLEVVLQQVQRVVLFLLHQELALNDQVGEW
jgi:hypothetical protein